MRKLKKSELKRVYGGGHYGETRGKGEKIDDEPGDWHSLGAGDTADVVTAADVD